MESTLASFAVSQLQWTDTSVQTFISSQIASWVRKLCRRGVSWSDLMQEMAVVFITAKAEFSGEETAGRFFAFLKACCQRRLVDLDRLYNQRAGRSRVRDWSSCWAEDNWQMDVVPSRRDETGHNDLELDIESAPPAVREFLRAWMEVSYKTKPEGGRAAFCMRVCGTPWPKVKKILKEWASRTLQLA